MTSLKAIQSSIIKNLKKHDVQTSVIDAKMIITHITDFTNEDFILRPDAHINKTHILQINEIVARRIAGEPLTRILGVREFWGLEFKVTPDTLDPRPDTETLIEATFKWIDKAGLRDAPMRILDLGTGTGCISIALLSELPEATAVAVDYSFAAASMARQNAEMHNMADRLNVIQGDWMSALKPQSFDLIVSNPPYISNPVIETLSPEVKNHDPFLSLSGGEDGLDCYKNIISALKINLNVENRAFLEIGYDQLESVSRLVDESGLTVYDSMCDLAGNPRVVEIGSGDK